MKIDRKKVVGIQREIITSAWKPNYFVIEFFMMEDGQVRKLRYPLKSYKRALDMLDFLEGRNDKQVGPDYRVDTLFVNWTAKPGRVR